MFLWCPWIKIQATNEIRALDNIHIKKKSNTSSAELKNGVSAVQQYSIENQKGAIRC